MHNSEKDLKDLKKSNLNRPKKHDLKLLTKTFCKAPVEAVGQTIKEPKKMIKKIVTEFDVAAVLGLAGP